MSNDVSVILDSWGSFEAGVTARVVLGDDGTPLLQIREGMALQQMTLTGRPDGQKPHGYFSQFEYICRRMNDLPEPFEAWRELWRELGQYEVRRRGLLAAAADRHLADKTDEAEPLYALAVKDADHALAVIRLFMRECPDEEYVENARRNEPGILIQRGIAAAQQVLLSGDPDWSVEILKETHKAVIRLDDDDVRYEAAVGPGLEDLRILENTIRSRFQIAKTLAEQLDEAIAAEDYERAANIRNQINQRG